MFSRSEFSRHPVKHSQSQMFLFSNARTASEDAIFSHSTFSLLITGKVPKELWAWDISGPRKELKSDLVSCPFAWVPF